MAPTALKDAQLTMARYLRDPQSNQPPADIEQRRLQVYLDLVYNNIEGFVSGGFPVLRSLYNDQDWHGLVRAFIDGHRCHTPYFLEISQEFLKFLMDRHTPRPCDPPFILELAHYEWVELALDVAEGSVPDAPAMEDPLALVPYLSPLAWSLCYTFPVHRIGPALQPTEPGEPTYLVVYRNRAEEVRFLEINAATARLLALIKGNADATGHALLVTLAAELGIAKDAILDFGGGQLQEFLRLGVVLAVPDET